MPDAEPTSWAPPRTGSASPDDAISFWMVLAVLVRGRRLIAGGAVTLAVFFLLVGFLQPRSYRVESSFRPQGSEAGRGQLSSLASQFGVRIPAPGEGDTPEFYAELVRSRALLSRVAERRFPGVLEETAPLGKILGVEDPNPAVRDSRVIQWLREEALATSVGQETGIVTVAVTTAWPFLSAQLAEAVLEELNHFNAETRRSQAAAERGFVEGRLEAARDELLRAEAAQKAFLHANRSWQNSPELRFEHDRLHREVLMRQELYTSLSEAFEQARISEVRNTPVITVLQDPYVPAEPEGRRLALKVVLGLMIGGILGVTAAFVRELGAPTGSQDSQAWQEVRTWWSAVRSGRVREVV